MRKFGLIGYPLDHSFSPEYFRQKFIRENISGCSYELFPLKKIDQLPLLLKENLSGLNVTVPYKETVIPFLDELDELANKVGAVNCIRITYASGKVLTKGFNTDVMGFERSITPLLQPKHQQALIFGDGGSARAVKFVLEKLGISYQMVTRSGNELSYADIKKKIIDTHHILINTTPVGMYPDIKNTLLLPFELITSDHLCYDLIYNPEKTEFLQRSEANGATVKNGLEMLMIQAEESWNIWNRK